MSKLSLVDFFLTVTALLLILLVMCSFVCLDYYCKGQEKEASFVYEKASWVISLHTSNQIEKKTATGKHPFQPFLNFLSSPIVYFLSFLEIL